MQTKNKETIYFAGSIRGGRNDQALYYDIINHLSSIGKVLTEHVGDSNLAVSGEVDKSDEYIFTRDINWLHSATAIVAEVTTASLGVGYEVCEGIHKGIPVLCLYRKVDNKKTSAMLLGNKHLTVKEYQTLEEAKEIINHFFKSKGEMFYE